MIKRLLFCLSLFVVTVSSSQNSYDFELVQDVNNQYVFTVNAIPSISASNLVFVRSGIHFLIETGESIGNFTSILGSNWDVFQTISGPDLLTIGGIGDGTKDYVFLQPGLSNQSYSQTVNVALPLVTFEVTSAPATGMIELIDNDHPIAVALQNAGNTSENYFSEDSAGTNNLFNTITGTTSYTFIDPPLSLKGYQKGAFNISPNPSRGLFELQFDQKISNATLQVLDVTGKLVMDLGTQSTFAKKINVDASVLENGIYFLLLKHNNESFARKIQLSK